MATPAVAERTPRTIKVLPVGTPVMESMGHAAIVRRPRGRAWGRLFCNCAWSLGLPAESVPSAWRRWFRQHARGR